MKKRKQKRNAMKKQIIISCAMLMDEVNYVCKGLEIYPEIIWMKRAMHKAPHLLNQSLQQIIDENQNVDNILLTYGLCGNSTPGIVSKNTRLIIPRFHDCIHQLLYRQKICGHYYLTRGWTLDREEIYQQSKLILSRYGEADGKEILERIYDGYTDIDVIDTSAYVTNSVVSHAEKFAEILNRKVNKIPGSTEVLYKLFTGNWDSDFIVLEPGEVLQVSHFTGI